MTFHRFFLILLLVILALGAGCGQRKVVYKTSDRFPPKSPDEEVRLYVTGINQPHLEFAWVESFTAAEETPEARRDQLRDLRERARLIGADAVINIRSMTNQIKNVTIDEAVPFPAWTQGDWNSYFLRGVAVRFLDAEETDEFDFEAFEGRTRPSDDEELDPETIPRLEPRQDEEPRRSTDPRSVILP